jgi:ubiquinol-cytochrome c reductase cytochrome c subunit
VNGRPVSSVDSTPPGRKSKAGAASALASRRRHPLATLLLLVVGLTLMGGLYAVVSATGAASAASPNPSQVSQGRSLFLEGCASCHGLNAQGNNSTTTTYGPSLVGVGAAAVDFQVGTGRMPLAAPGPQADQRPVTYTQNEINALAAYVASLGPGPAIPSASDLDTTNANLQQGGELFRTNCAQCHNFAGSGGALSKGASAPSLKTATAKQMYEAMLTGPGQMPVFSNNTIPSNEKRDIIKYVEAIRSSPNPGGLALGRLGPVTEGLFLWVVGMGAITAVAVWIGIKSS